VSKSIVGNTIKERRKMLKITQSQLAEMAEVSINTLYKIERGQANPSLETLEKIGDILGLMVVLQVKNINP